MKFFAKEFIGRMLKKYFGYLNQKLKRKGDGKTGCMKRMSISKGH
jgi:hypothetical protein